MEQHIKYKTYSKAQVNEAADRFETLDEWKQNDRLTFVCAKRRKTWLIEILKRRNWNEPEALLLKTDLLNETTVKEEAKKYSTLKDWQLNSKSTYQWAWRNKVIEKYSKHMATSRKWKNREAYKKENFAHI